MIQDFVDEIEKMIDKTIGEIHTAMPGEIVSFNAEKGLVNVLPKGKYRSPDGRTFDYPEIPDVPAVFMQSASQEVTIAYPIKKGDGCLIIFCEQSIDHWLLDGETGISLKHDLRNAIVIPGLFRKVNETVKEATKTDSIIIKNKSAKIVLTDEKVSIKGDVAIEGNTTVKGNLSVDGNINATGTIRGN